MKLQNADFIQKFMTFQDESMKRLFFIFSHIVRQSPGAQLKRVCIAEERGRSMNITPSSVTPIKGKTSLFPSLSHTQLMRRKKKKIQWSYKQRGRFHRGYKFKLVG